MKKKELATDPVRLYPSTRERLRRKSFNSKPRISIAELVDRLEKESKNGTVNKL